MRRHDSKVEPERIEFETGGGGPNEPKPSTRLKLDTEDIIAIFAGLVAIIIALGMAFGKIPVNGLTVGVLSFAGVGAAIAKIIGARKRNGRKRNGST